MDETIIFPSPNWYHTSILAVSNDGWIIYGGPSKSLCVLEPVPQGPDTVIRVNQSYKAHAFHKAHPEKVVCVDICPEWPEKRCVLTGSCDGTVKQWILEQTENTLMIKSTHSHDVHKHEKEEVVGVGYFNNGYAVSVGSFGHIVKWDLTSNVVKSFNKVLANYKPTSISCSPHIHLNVAIGTRQGVTFLLDLNGNPIILYKVRGHDDEILKVSWCPQYEVILKKYIKNIEKISVATKRMEKIRTDPEDAEVMKALDLRVSLSQLPKADQSGEDLTSTVKQQNDEAKVVKQPELYNEPTGEKTEESKQTSDLAKPSSSKETDLDKSGIEKTLPEDSFDEFVIIPEDDMFDVYKEPADTEFGHKKYEPEDILVKVDAEKKNDDYLADCLKLKEEILKRKNEPEPTIEALVDALDKTHVDGVKDPTSDEIEAGSSSKKAVDVGKTESSNKKSNSEVSSLHIHRHLLASVSRNGSVRIWSKSGKLVASCALQTYAQKGKLQKNTQNWSTLLWYKPGVLLMADGRGHLVQTDPLQIDCKNKLSWRVVHSLHKRGLFCIASNAPRVQLPNSSADDDQSDDWSVWTSSIERTLTRYSLKKKEVISSYNTCGAYLYCVQSCPYDPRRVAISVGDGAVRVWEADTTDGETALTSGHVTAYWHNVLGKVLTVAWHPTKENWLAFGTAEARVGTIDTSGRSDRPAKVLQSALSGGVYSLCWGEGAQLYACGGFELVRYRLDKPDDAPTTITVELEGHRWEPCAVQWAARGLACGDAAGAVAVLQPCPPHQPLAFAFVFEKPIHTVVWHPQETTNSTGESPFQNLIAVCSQDRVNTVVILDFGDKKDGGKQLTVWKTLSGHKGTVLQLAWNPHIDAQLLSTSQDATVRIWDIVEGVCTSIFAGHAHSAISAAWIAFPTLAGAVVSGGGDCCLRLWDAARHPADRYTDGNEDSAVTRNEKRRLMKKQAAAKKKNRRNREKNDEEVSEDSSVEREQQEATVSASKFRVTKKFLLPMITKQLTTCSVNGPKRLMQKYLEKNYGVVVEKGEPSDEYDIDYIKMFGTINDINELLDMELARHVATGNSEGWIMLSIVRGRIDDMVQYASQRDMLDPFLVSLAPCVSFRYWKDTSLLYLAQIDRLVAKGAEIKLWDNQPYGGAVYRKVATLLSLHDVKGALALLLEVHLYKEAYILCRTRYMDSIAEDVLRQWAQHSSAHGFYVVAAVSYLVLGDLSAAAAVLGKTSDEDFLSLAADIAKVLGQNTYAGHIEVKREQILNNKDQNQDKTEVLEELPTRSELLLKSDTQNELSTETKADPTTEVMLEELPSKMEVLMKDDGSGDSIPNIVVDKVQHADDTPNPEAAGEDAQNVEVNTASN